MQRVSRGYTIVEIMIVLAVSSMMILMASKFLAGSRGHTEFSQSMRDLQSQVQSWLDDVSNGNAYGDNSTAHCYRGGTSVKIDGSGRPANPAADCIFLGKAIQFTDDPSTSVYAYTVFGCRQTPCTPTGSLVSTIQESGPTPATGTTGNGNANFTDTYTLQNGTTLKRVLQPSSGGLANSHMAGFYSSLNTDSVIGQNGQTDLIGYQYPIGNYPNINQPEIVHCIEAIGSPCRFNGSGSPDALGTWQLCFKNNANAETAELTIAASANGFNPQVRLDFVACS